MWQNHTEAVVTAIHACRVYVTLYHIVYLQHHGFNNVTEYCNYLETHPDKMDLLAVLFTVMINRTHVCIVHPRGYWHTHVAGHCACSLVLAHTGNFTFIALQLSTPPAICNTVVVKKPTQHKSKQKTGASFDTQRKGTPPQDPQTKDLLHWVNCTPFQYPTPMSEKKKNHIFCSVARLQVRKEVKEAKTKVYTPPTPPPVQQMTESDFKSEDDLPVLVLYTFLHKKRSLKCKKCSYKTVSPYHLTEHKKKCVEGVKFNCMDCDQIFDHRMQLYRHVLKTH